MRRYIAMLILAAALVSTGCSGTSSSAELPKPLGATEHFGVLPPDEISAEIAAAIGLYRAHNREWPISLADLNALQVHDRQSATTLRAGLEELASFACLPRDARRTLVVLQLREPAQTYVFDVEMVEHPDGKLVVTLASADRTRVRRYAMTRTQFQLTRTPPAAAVP